MMNAERMNDELKTVALVPRSAFIVAISGGDDRILTCEGLLTLNGLANRRLQPLGHISAEPYKAKNHSNRRLRIVKVRQAEIVVFYLVLVMAISVRSSPGIPPPVKVCSSFLHSEMIASGDSSLL